MRIRELAHRIEVVEKDSAPAAPQPGTARDETFTAATDTTVVTVHVKESRPLAAGAPSAVRTAHLQAAKLALADSARAIADMTRWKRLRAWWTGTAVTAGWESVHDAEAELVNVEREDEVRASLPRLLAWIQQVMPSGDQRTRYEQQLTDFMNSAKPLDVTAVEQAYQDVIRANNEKHANLRAFRNLLAGVTAVLAATLVALAVWHALNVNFVSLCGRPATPSQTTGPTATAGTPSRRCLTGPKPTARDIAEIELVGAIGGLLSIAFGLGSVETPPSRYNPRPQQGALKPAAGAATALIGVLLVQSGVLIAPAASASESLLLAYAAIFGFAQQLLTQFVDKRAGKLLGDSDGKG